MLQGVPKPVINKALLHGALLQGTTTVFSQIQSGSKYGHFWYQTAKMWMIFDRCFHSLCQLTVKKMTDLSSIDLSVQLLE